MQLSYHQCTEADRAKFFEVTDESGEHGLNEDFTNMMCLDEPELVDLKGQIFTQEASYL